MSTKAQTEHTLGSSVCTDHPTHSSVVPITGLTVQLSSQDCGLSWKRQLRRHPQGGVDQIGAGGDVCCNQNPRQQVKEGQATFPPGGPYDGTVQPCQYREDPWCISRKGTREYIPLRRVQGDMGGYVRHFEGMAEEKCSVMRMEQNVWRQHSRAMHLFTTTSYIQAMIVLELMQGDLRKFLQDEACV